MSKRRLQVILTDDAWAAVDSATAEANNGFDAGSINYSDTINEMILTSKIDIKLLQSKHTNIRKSLRLMAAQESVDLDDVIKALQDLKTRTTKKGKTPAGREPSNE